MRRTLQPLAPAKAKRAPDGQPPLSVVARRKPVSIACDRCRTQKTRCDGARPVCAHCRQRSVVCIYEAEETRKTRLETLEAQRDAVTQENSRLWQLFRMLQTLPHADADEILRQLRSTDDPFALLRLARRAVPPIGAGAGFVPQEQGESRARLSVIDLRALATSPLKVPARPWTSVAGDGVVSELISSFFKSFTSRAAKACSAALGDDIGARFLNEAKKLWHLENNQASLTNVQALAILFTVSAYRGADRQGLVYRFSAYEMLTRLDLPSVFSIADDTFTNGSRIRAVVSKAIWGLFCFESIVGYVYFQQSLLPVPQIPRHFEDGACPKTIDHAQERPDDNTSNNQAALPGVLNATCDMSILLYRIMQYNSVAKDLGSETDVAKRRQFDNEIHRLWNNLPDTNLKHRVYVDELFISTWRAVAPSVAVKEGHRGTAGDLLTECAIRDTKLSRQYIQQYGLLEYSCMTLCGIYNAILILVERLDDKALHSVFTETCAMIRRTAADFPMARFILQGIMAIAWSLDLAIPARALPYLQNLGMGKEELVDIPLAFAIPETVVVRSLLTYDNDGADDLKEMGSLLSKWSSLTID
ncbi:hypothetical protein NLG97_g1076 [Lecanicillium saksenae]|uniref:Uncharacterized protein n=1 Tax=Lecanicillium saksenae TaxID=468837 RepID=A0ACC1R502_9HYPO|nr:hypothetical protein NLG97_g1076 [Lecanicillium saksenae]